MWHGEAAAGVMWQNGWSHIQVWWINIGRDTSGVRGPSPGPDRAAQGSSAGERKPRNLWLEKPVGVGVMQEAAGYSGESV